MSIVYLAVLCLLTNSSKPQTPKNLCSNLCSILWSLLVGARAWIFRFRYEWVSSTRLRPITSAVRGPRGPRTSDFWSKVAQTTQFRTEISESKPFCPFVYIGDKQRCFLRLGASWNFSTRGRILQIIFQESPPQRPVGPLRGVYSRNPAPSGEIPRSPSSKNTPSPIPDYSPPRAGPQTYTKYNRCRYPQAHRHRHFICGRSPSCT